MGISSRERTVQRQGHEAQVLYFTHYNRKVRQERIEWKSFGCNFWISTVRNLTCQVWILTSHTPAATRRGSRLSGRKKTPRRPMPFILQTEELPLAMSVPKSGNIMAAQYYFIMQNMMEDMAKASFIRTDGLSECGCRI